MATEKNFEKAQALLAANFCMYGVGNFDLTVNDIAGILDLLQKHNRSQLLKEKYDALKKQRMG
ncbi:MAG: hypothetical protein DYG83_18315 [Candidatus Brocadia sp. AMX2]|uniref:Uncharacterized protein n=1 Tax=Candidatus Brocadia sinica JPN1 TaxID=1197129 RepID=A0ABQ0K018_9BACT|nr:MULTISPECIES: hypothetical protein [Brocadia]MBC6934186.1 hypothetical protein [Candidatus Brocadia sp.]MBL1170462.1 hypothetical protein [Candidatus Brocadia sp. AMX1]NOG40069.1 hypothetical protein [Planctomycetota bacterium]GIK14374.1 MAG: hypothetical protein BroJett002_30810 [Candidatus Brocadia sinica]KAA0240983.1 MAG: hypothetical protein EDM70_18815 [Candidatus Brocadia sp. AMX2]